MLPCFSHRSIPPFQFAYAACFAFVFWSEIDSSLTDGRDSGSHSGIEASVQIRPIISAVFVFRLAVARAFVAVQFGLSYNSRQSRCELSQFRLVGDCEAENPRLQCY
jgi:hypothetical protein